MTIKWLCRPCKEGLGEIKKITPAGYNTKKETCAECGRRRYCSPYIVENRDK